MSKKVNSETNSAVVLTAISAAFSRRAKSRANASSPPGPMR
jgi:hypothetical protein